MMIASITIQVAWAQGKKDHDTSSAEEIIGGTGDSVAAQMTGPPIATTTTPDSVELQQRATLRSAQVNWAISAYRHRTDSFAWQLFSGKILFFLVSALVLVGIYFSWQQFRKAMKLADNRAKAVAAGNVIEVEGGNELAQTLKVSTEGVELQSSVLGVVILVLSLCFFYLYLVHIYPITEVASQNDLRLFRSSAATPITDSTSSDPATDRP